MEPFDLMEIPYFLLHEAWKENGVEFGRISYMISSVTSYDEHVELYRRERQRLIDLHDEDYSSWVFTGDKYRNMGGARGHVTVFHFRIKEVY